MAVAVALVALLPAGSMLLNETSPNLCDSVRQFSGYFHLRTGPGSKNYFYWGFESRRVPKEDPVVLWLTGGPGCSSEVALFAENGPCKVNAAGTGTTRNMYSWNTAANLLYVDQPTGTGFSYGSGYDHDERGVADDMYDFLLQFFAKHVELADNDLYIFGESYAGHYVPAIAHRVWRGNKQGGAPKLPLRGVAVGNGLTDPEVQYAYYPDMAISTNGHKPAVSSLTHAAMKLALPACLATIRACNAANSSMADAACAAAQTGCNAAEVMPYQVTGLNVYDMRIPCEVPGLCYDFSNIGKYLARADVRRELGINPAHAEWEDCNMVVNMAFRTDWMKDYQQRLPDLLADGIRVLIYAGDQDYICNWLGNKAWTLKMDWPGQAAFARAKDLPWTAPTTESEGKPTHAGELRTAKGLSFLRMFNAGHMAPMDQPAASLAMLDRFLAGKL